MIVSRLLLSIKAQNMDKSRCFFMSILFRIVSSLNHFQLPLFMRSKVNETILRQLLGLYCFSKLRIWLNHDGFFMSILFMIDSSLKHFQVPLFKISKVNETILRQFLGLYSLLMLRIWLNHVNVNIIQVCFQPESLSVTSVHVK